MRKIFICLVFIGVIILLCNLFDNSYAYSYDIDNSVLFYKDNYIELESDIKKYINNIDDYIIPNSSYLYGDKLIDNYDFLVYFATDYILNNREYYNSFIKQYDKCSYFNKNSIDSYTYDYIDINKIYDITDFYFGIKDFVIINDDVCTNDNYVSLIDYANDLYTYDIINAKIINTINSISVIVTYDSGESYLYLFDNINNVLKLKNIEVV